jgi:ornithine--oxo-acid transaminase
MSFIKGLIEEHLSSSDHLSKKHIHPRLSKMLDLAGMNVAFTRAEGSHLWDINGNRYLDLLSGGGVHFIGRHHPEVRGAIDAVNAADIPNLCVVNSSVLGGILAGKLLQMAGPGFTKVQYSNSGAEANEVAIRFARFCTRKRRFLHMQGAFHGRTYGAISLCGFHQMNEGMDPKMPTCTMITPNDIEELRSELRKGDVAGVFYEYCQGMTLTVLEREYLHEMRRLCTEYGAMMIADEVQTGFARVGGEWFAFQKAGVLPDMVSLSKALSGGEVPVAATLIGDHVYETVFSTFKSGPIYFSTFAENNLAMAAGLATLKVLEDIDARKAAIQISDKIRAGLAEIQARYDVIERVAGEGLMVGVYFRPSESRTLLKIQQKLLSNADKGVFGASVNVEMFTKHRVITQIPGPEVNAIKILPPVNLSSSDISHFLEAFEGTMASMYKSGGPALPLGKAAVRDAFRTAKQKIIGGGDAPAKK